jgi:hypothetical protein
MGKVKLFSAIVLVIALMAVPTATMASNGQAPRFDDVVIFGQDYTLASGQTIDGSLVVFGGNVNVESGATIQKDLVVFGGNVEMDGQLQGDAFVMGGNIRLGPNAIVEGDVASPGGNITRDPGAQIRGNQVSEVGPFFSRGFDFNWASWTLGSVVWSVFQALAMSAVAVLIALFAPEYMRRTAGAIIQRPLESGGLGILTLILLPFVLIITIITCIGPLVIGLLAIAALALGWVALGYELGRRMARAFNQDWTIVLEAWVGTLSLGVGASLIGIVPCVGWLVPLVLGGVGLGAVLLTRFGTLGEPAPALGTQPAVPAKRVVRSTPRKTTRRTK